VRFQMEKINNGGTLQDWLQAHAEQAMPRDLWAQIFKRLQHNIREVWEHGVIHGDLHVRNVVIGLDAAARALEPIVIDFGVAQLDGDSLLALAHGYGLRDEVADSQAWFERQVDERYNDPADERDFLVADLQSWMTRLNISDLDRQLADFRRALRP
jgi:aminoglycoside phosphotransferase (APT) family kinase protein